MVLDEAYGIDAVAGSGQILTLSVRININDRENHFFISKPIQKIKASHPYSSR